MGRFAIITEVEIYSGEDRIGTVEMEYGIGYKAKLEDSFMSKEDICFVGKVQEFLDEHEDGKIIMEEK